MPETSLIRVPQRGDNTLAYYLGELSDVFEEEHRELLNEIARACTERGWVQPVAAMIDKLVDAGSDRYRLTSALDDLIYRRLVDVDGERFTGFLGGIALFPTQHRAQLPSGIAMYAHGGMELLTFESTLLKPVTVQSRCPVTELPLKLVIANEEIIDASPRGIAGFVCDWDGQERLAEVAARSPLFVDNRALDYWISKRPELRGTELPAELLLWMGMEAAKRIGHLRFKLIGHHG